MRKTLSTFEELFWLHCKLLHDVLSYFFIETIWMVLKSSMALRSDADIHNFCIVANVFSNHIISYSSIPADTYDDKRVLRCVPALTFLSDMKGCDPKAPRPKNGKPFCLFICLGGCL